MCDVSVCVCVGCLVTSCCFADSHLSQRVMGSKFVYDKRTGSVLINAFFWSAFEYSTSRLGNMISKSTYYKLSLIKIHCWLEWPTSQARSEGVCQGDVPSSGKNSKILGKMTFFRKKCSANTYIICPLFTSLAHRSRQQKNSILESCPPHHTRGSRK